MVLRGLLLLSSCLLFSGIRAMEQEKTLDQNTVFTVYKFLQQYQPGTDLQYAMAFNVPADKCADYLDINFLSEYPVQTVRQAINSPARLYNGDKLIAARPKPIPGTNPPVNQHSEYLLLKLPSVAQSPMKNLLNRDRTGCVMFYTYNSPCTKTCTNPRSCYNILDALDMFKNHTGPKAFVFSKIWKYDCDNDISSNLEEVLQRVPLYRCKNSCCVFCGGSRLENCI